MLIPPATVPQIEHTAIIQALSHAIGHLDLTTDCKGALRTLQATLPHKTDMPEWGDVWHQRDRVTATWVRAHQEAADFAKEFPNQEWRRRLNAAADQLAGWRARDALNLHAARRVQEVDRVATEVNDYLAFKAEEQLQSKENQFVPKAVRDTMSQFDKTQQRPHAKALYANKRARLKQMVQESSVGHAWKYTRGEEATNLQLKCSVCDLWIQQTYAQDVFQRVDQHPCRGFPRQGPQFWPALHPSHKWFSTGKTWECYGCGVSFGPTASKEPSKASKPCSKGKLGVAKLSFKTSSSRTEPQPDQKQASPTEAEEHAPKAQATSRPKALPKNKQAKAKPKPKASLAKTEVQQTANSTSSIGQEASNQILPKHASLTPSPKALPQVTQAKPKPKPKQTLLSFAVRGSNGA